MGHNRLKSVARFVFLLHGAIGAFSQTREFSFDHVTVEEGLSQSTVYAIVQDADGFMWFGTRDGLNKYDSRKVKVYRYNAGQERSLADNVIYALHSGKDGRLWIGTGNGLSLYDPRSDDFTNIRNVAADPSSLSGNTVSCFYEDRGGGFWIGTRSGLNLLKAGRSVEFLRFHHSDADPGSLSNSDVRSLFGDSRGNLWVGTAAGLSKAIRTSDGYRFKSYDTPDGQTAARGNWINSIAEGADGKILVATEKTGLMLFDPETEQFQYLPWIGKSSSSPEAIRTILDSDGEYWIGTIGGLTIVNPGLGNYTRLRNIADAPASLSDNSVRSLYKDRDGSIWIGTFHGGVNSYSPISKQFESLHGETRIPYKVASALMADPRGDLWIGTEGSGLLLTHHDGTTLQHFRHQPDDPFSLSHNNVKCLLLDGDKGIWAGTIKGLNYYDFRKRRFIRYMSEPGKTSTLPDESIYSLVKDDRNNLWIATYRGGLCRYNPSAGTFETFANTASDSTSLSADGATSLFIDSRKNLWVGTTSGLNMKPPGRTIFHRFLNDPDNSTTISGNYILSFCEDRRNRLWVGTRDNGLNMMVPGSQKFIHFGREHGLAGNTIYGVQEDNAGFLWISTENGLSKLNPSDLSTNNYDRHDGLICKEFNHNSYCKDSRGNMYFGGYNGVVVFDPSSISENTVVPRLSFVSLKLFRRGKATEQSLSRVSEFTFRHDENVFSIHFAVLNYVNSTKNQFAYRLEGFEDEWNHSPEPVATYMNLRPGNYTLLAKGSNNDGLWNQAPISMRLKVLPAPWKSWWAYSIYVTIFLGLLYAWARINRKRLELKHDLEIEHLENKKQDELHRAKLSFFANIVHEIRTPLTLMSSPVDKILDQYHGDLFLKKELSLVKSNTDRLQRLLNQLLDFHKQETGNVRLKIQESNIVEFIDEIQVSFQEYAQSRKVSLSFCPQEPAISLWFDREELTKVFCNLLVNAFKFTPGGGTVAIRINKEPPSVTRGDFDVRITIEDNGLGIPSRHLEKIFHRFYQAEHSGTHEAGAGIGLALAKGIIDLHHGSIKVDSRESTSTASGFTRFTIFLTGGQAHFDPEQITTDVEDVDYIHQYKELEHASQEKATPRETEKPLILLVEDNDEIRSYVHEVLESRYNVLESRNGLQGMDIAVEQLPDLIVSDIMMPAMDGLEMVTRLRTDQRTSHIPIILLTARTALSHQVEGLETGADDYLIKPFDPRLLLVKIRSHLTIREKLKEKYSRIVTLQPRHEEAANPDERFLQRLMVILEEKIMDAEFNVSSLVREIGMSRPVLFRKTKMLTGLSVIDLIRNVRLSKAEMLLKQKKLTIAEVAFTVGFSDPKYFSKTFRNHFGKSPSQFLHELDQLPT